MAIDLNKILRIGLVFKTELDPGSVGLSGPRLDRSFLGFKHDTFLVAIRTIRNLIGEIRDQTKAKMITGCQPGILYGERVVHQSVRIRITSRTPLRPSQVALTVKIDDADAVWAHPSARHGEPESDGLADFSGKALVELLALQRLEQGFVD